MKHKYYLPFTDLEKVTWLLNFQSKLSTYAGPLGITPAQLISVGSDANYFAAVVSRLPTFRDYFKTLTAYKDALRDGSLNPIGPFPSVPFAPPDPPVLAGIFKRIQDMVRTIKASSAYTQAMGEDLGIIGAEIDTTTTAIKPLLKVSHKNEHAYLRWNHEHTTAADVRADHGDGGGFKIVARIVSTHYLDALLPAAGDSKIYKYQIRYVVGDEQVGEWSDTAEITVTGS